MKLDNLLSFKHNSFSQVENTTVILKQMSVLLHTKCLKKLYFLKTYTVLIDTLFNTTKTRYKLLALKIRLTCLLISKSLS